MRILWPRGLIHGFDSEFFPHSSYSYAAKIHIKERRFFLSSLNKFFIQWLLSKIPACKVLKKFLTHSTLPNSSLSLFYVKSKFMLDCFFLKIDQHINSI